MKALLKSEAASIRRELKAANAFHKAVSKEKDRAVKLAFTATRSAYLSRGEAGWVIMALIALVVAATAVIVAFR